jgi:hypothetical protein
MPSGGADSARGVLTRHLCRQAFDYGEHKLAARMGDVQKTATSNARQFSDFPAKAELWCLTPVATAG